MMLLFFIRVDKPVVLILDNKFLIHPNGAPPKEVLELKERAALLGAYLVLCYMDSEKVHSPEHFQHRYFQF